MHQLRNKFVVFKIFNVTFVKISELANQLKGVVNEISNNIGLVRDKMNQLQIKIDTMNVQMSEMNESLERSLREIEEKEIEIAALKKSIHEINTNQVDKVKTENRTDEEIDQLVSEIEYCIRKLKENHG